MFYLLIYRKRVGYMKLVG